MSDREDGESARARNGGFLMMNLLHRYYWFDEALNGNLVRRGWPGITPGQSLVMIHVALGMNRASTIARDLGVSRQAMSQMLRDMKSLGLIAFAPDPDDRRAQLVQFAPEAEAIRHEAVAMLENAEALLAERIGKRALLSLRSALAKDWGSPPEFGDDGAIAAPLSARGSEEKAVRPASRRRQVR